MQTKVARWRTTLCSGKSRRLPCTARGANGASNPIKKKQVKDFTEHHKLTELLDPDEIQIQSICPVTDNYMEVYYTDDVFSPHVNMKSSIYADDTTQVIAGHNVMEVASTLEEDLRNINK